jgi:hypothetical protein
MKECDNSKIHISSKLHIVYKSSNNVGHLITKTITTMQHFTTLHHTSPNHTSLHLSTLHLKISLLSFRHKIATSGNIIPL